MEHNYKLNMERIQSEHMIYWDYSFIPVILATFTFGYLQLRFMWHYISDSYAPAYRGLSDKLKVSWCNRLNTIVFSSLIGAGSLYGTLVDSPISSDRIRGVTLLGGACTAMATGVLILELAVDAVHAPGDVLPSVTLHHVAGVIATLASLLSGCYQWFCILKLLSEISTPFLQFGWFMKSCGVPVSSKLYIVNALMFVVTFFTFRIFTLPALWTGYLSLRHTDGAISTGNVWYIIFYANFVLDILNIYWGQKIIRGLLRGNLKRE